jgi:UDPglucose--hexose-1-phosphate uridylyltransferase
MMPPFNSQPHRRFNPLTGMWTLVAVGRTQRPWSGKLESASGDERPAYDPDCYLCPRNTRAGGIVNPDYEKTFVFTNDFASLQPDTPLLSDEPHPLFRTETEQGTCRVICFSPRHDLTLALMNPEEIRCTIDLWASETAELAERYRWVQVFENRGPEMGASNPHPHGQIWAGSALPTQAFLEDQHQRAHRTTTGRSLLVEYADVESSEETRIIVANDEWMALIPYWATWPFETLVLPRRTVSRLPDLSVGQRDALSEVLTGLLVRYDNLFERPFPYSMGWHGAPGTEAAPHWQLHAHFYPPLLNATMRKFMVGYEMLAEGQRDITPEDAARHLQSLPPVHYLRRGK